MLGCFSLQPREGLALNSRFRRAATTASPGRVSVLDRSRRAALRGVSSRIIFGNGKEHVRIAQRYGAILTNCVKNNAMDPNPGPLTTRPATVLLLHGWFCDARPERNLPAFAGFEVVKPKLSDFSFRRAVRAARQAYEQCGPT